MQKKTTPFVVGLVVIIVITITLTVVAGHLTARWWGFPGQKEASTRLLQLPAQMGNWVAGTEGTLDDESISSLRIQNSYIVRQYKHAVTQEVVHLTLMVGPSGKITAHTPEVCFGGRDFVKEATRVPVPFDVQLTSGEDVADVFWRVNFLGQSILDVGKRISFYYAISVGDTWQAVENPRTSFQAYRYVYKLQAQAQVGAGTGEDAVKKFLADCLPTIHEYLRQCY